MKSYARVLAIAGSDSGGGAGLQADLKTCSALGCFCATAVTAITAQNTRGVLNIHPLPASLVKDQIEAVLTDLGANALKIGMLFTIQTIETVSILLKKHHHLPVILDPVMVAKGGASLLPSQALEAFTSLLPQVLLVTPNLEEASLLLGRRVAERNDMPQAARDLIALGARNVLLKGGHLASPGSDCLATQDHAIHWFEREPIKTINTHGTGCTLSAAIAACMARGYSLIDAIGRAKAFLHDALIAGASFRLGSGHGPLHPFYALWS